MTAVALVAEPTAVEDDRITAGLWSAIEPEFLTLLGWDPAVKVLTLPQDHPLLGWKVCAVHECRKATRSTDDLCSTCRKRRTAAPELSWEEFLSAAKPHRRSIDLGYCSVPRCARPRQSSRQPLCSAHLYQRQAILRLPLNAFLSHPEVVPLPGFGPCLVAACTRDRVGKDPYCLAHRKRWRDARLRDGVTDEDQWRRTTPGITEDNKVSLRGLPARVVAEVVYGLQERTKHGIKNVLWRLRPLCDLARARQVRSLSDLEPLTLSRANRILRDGLITHARRRGRNPETERHEDVWDLAVFGVNGMLRFTEISQPWLREATKRWAFDDLPRRRGRAIGGALQTRVNSITQLSARLRLQREDHGDIPALLAHADITAFCNRLAYLTQEGTISAHRRTACCRDTRHLLSRMRALGLTRSGEPLAGLTDEFTLGPDDIPDEPEDIEAGKDLPTDVMRHLCAHLDGLEDTNCVEMRVAVELMIDTGRRPDEICHLHLDCLDRDEDGKPVLVYDNIKAHRQGCRLPIPEATAAVITAQQQRVRERFLGEPIDQLKLLPAPARNPHGRRTITAGAVGHRHRDWVRDLPDVSVPTVVEIGGAPTTKMLPFDKKKIFPYAYRHTYAQRHADAGVPVDVLRDLMNHRQLSTTQQYYRVGEERRREAVERVTTMQFDRHGNRVWRQAKALLDSEHARRAVGEVAVPYGGCSEPANVAAGGQDCPLRFRCVGCGHFSTDISYLPDLERYLADLLRHRERLAATVDADEWARSEALPSDEEIKRIRRLIERMKGDLDELTEQEQAQIEGATAIVRRGRGTIVGLGMPRIRQPLPTCDRSAAHDQQQHADRGPAG